MKKNGEILLNNLKKEKTNDWINIVVLLIFCVLAIINLKNITGILKIIIVIVYIFSCYLIIRLILKKVNQKKFNFVYGKYISDEKMLKILKKEQFEVIEATIPDNIMVSCKEIFYSSKHFIVVKKILIPKRLIKGVNTVGKAGQYNLFTNLFYRVFNIDHKNGYDLILKDGTSIPFLHKGSVSMVECTKILKATKVLKFLDDKTIFNPNSDFIEYIYNKK